MRSTFLLLASVMVLTDCSNTSTPTKERFKAYYAETAPIIDGSPEDSVWNAIPEYYTEHHIWIDNVGEAPAPEDLSWRYKLAWNEDKFYVLAEITDDIIRDVHPDPRVLYYEDDCFEVLFDEDNSGGDHEESYQAFIYHISVFYDALDIDAEGNRVILNEHLEVKMDTLNGKSIWEAGFSVYDKDYTSAKESTPVKLHTGKIMGWGMAYCDNDGGQQRDHFIGSHFIPGEDKNQTWKSADAFAEVELIN